MSIRNKKLDCFVIVLLDKEYIVILLVDSGVLQSNDHMCMSRPLGCVFKLIWSEMG